MTDRRPIVGGNWKMNTDRDTADRLARDVAVACADAVADRDIIVFPPFPYLEAVRNALGSSGVRLGAQDVYHEANGAYTGEVSVAMLLDLDVSHVIIGHSERRHVIGESDNLINAKVRAALDGGLEVVLCVGETLEQREAGETEAVTLAQVRAGLDGIDPNDLKRLILAYEPVWAIGTGRTATADDAQTVHAAIRAELSRRYDNTSADTIRIQYGGSVKPDNAGELFARPDIDGGLIGGASLNADHFASIVSAAGVAAGDRV